MNNPLAIPLKRRPERMRGLGVPSPPAAGRPHGVGGEPLVFGGVPVGERAEGG